MSHICFVTDELYPVTGGGAGTLIYNFARLLKQSGHQVSILLDAPERTYYLALDAFTDSDMHPRLDGIYLVSELANDLPPHPDGAFSGWYYWRSHRYYWALRKVCESTKIDFVEFNDFYGTAYYSLVGKLSGAALATTTIGVRLHTPWELLLMNGDAVPMSRSVLAIRFLERATLRLAEQVLAASDEYVSKVFQPHYEAGLGVVRTAEPAVLTWPRRAETMPVDPPNIVLFYGRLQPIKGPDLLLAAALEVASVLPESEYWFIGGDSELTRDLSVKSYRELLEQRIPARLTSRFRFVGRISFEDMSSLLPRVRLAVFPSFIESFCYAAHELHRAGVPIIVSDLPSFTRHFRHDENALVFDGTIADLATQIHRLYCDGDLRRRLVMRTTASEAAVGLYLETTHQGSWMAGDAAMAAPLRVLILIEDDKQFDASRTVESVLQQIGVDDQLVLLSRAADCLQETPLIFLDTPCHLREPRGEFLSPSQVRTRDALLILTAGDELLPGALQEWRHVLGRYEKISFVGGWLRRSEGSDAQQPVDCIPIEVCLDQLLFERRPLRQRVLMRTVPGLRLDDVFDFRQGRLGEIGHLWKLDATVGPGISIPGIRVICRPETAPVPIQAYPALAAYMVASDTSERRQKSLALRSLLADSEARGPEMPAVSHGPTSPHMRKVRQFLARVRHRMGRSLRAWFFRLSHLR